MIIRETAPPVTEPVTIDEFKAHARIDGDSEDDYILSILKAAREAIERRLDIAGPPRTVELIADGFPPNGHPIRLPISPLNDVVSILYRDGGGSVLDWEAYNVHPGEGGYILPPVGECYPEACGPGSVVITAVFGVESPPTMYKHAIKLLASTWFENRESILSGTIVNRIPDGFDFILSGLRQRRF